MAEESDSEKTEQPTGKRIADARADGNVPVSREFATFFILICGVLSLWALGGWMGGRLMVLLRERFSFEREAAFDHRLMMMHLYNALSDAVLTVAPFVTICLVVAVVGHILVSGWNFSSKALTLNFARMNPISGLGRMFSSRGLVELAKSILKVLVLGGVVVWVFWHEHAYWMGFVRLTQRAAILEFFNEVRWAAMIIVLGLALLAIVDVPYQLWNYYRKLRMTKEEVKQETKQQDGDPQVKGRIRRIQREMAMRRMMSNVPSADVVVTNPTHFSVALKYDGEKMNAPIVVAKGRGDVALRIRELAAEHGVPLLEAPPLARALYAHCELDQAVPMSLYTAVAEVLAYVYQLNAWMEKGGRRPKRPQHLSVPPELDPYTSGRGMPADEDGLDADDGAGQYAARELA